MKKLFSAFLFVMLLGSAYAQVSNDQNTVITKVSADWCPNCGGWAWPVFEDMRSEMADKNAIFVLAHRDGGLKNDVSLAWCLNLEYQYQPEFFLNNDEQSINGGTAPTVIASMVEQVDFLSTAGTFAGVEGQGTVLLADDQLVADIDVEFFNEIEGEFFLGVYTIQNNIIANQSGQGMVQQPKLLTGAFTEDWFGIPINGELGIQSHQFTIDTPTDFSSADGDTEVLSVIWLKDNEGIYRFFNAHTNGTILSVSSTNELVESIADMKANFVDNQLNIKVEAIESLSNARFVLTNIAGQKLFSSEATQLTDGLNELNYSMRDLQSGIYILSLQIGDKQISQKVFK